MVYRLFDTSINRLFGSFDTEEDALALVWTVVGANRDDADDLALGCERADGSFAAPLSGATLLARADEVAPEHNRPPASSRPGRRCC